MNKKSGKSVQTESNRGSPRWNRRWLGTLALVVISGTGCQTRPIEAGVLHSSGEVIRLAGRSTLEPELPAVLVYSSLSASAISRAREQEEQRGVHGSYPDPQPLFWHGDQLTMVDDGPTLLVSNKTGVIFRVDLRGLPYLREVYGATPAMDGSGEWLALLLHFRATSRREMMVIYNPAGVLVHQEILVRTIPTPSLLMWTAGAPTARQEVGVNLGNRHRFVVPKRP